MYRLGIIGTGFIAHEHVKAASDIDKFEICGLANRTLQKGIEFGRQYGIPEDKIYSSYKEMMDREKPDAVIVSLPHHLHKEAFIECAKRKIHVLMEKPMAIDSESCQQMNEWAEECCVKLMIGHTQRYNKNYVAAKKIIDSGSLGKLMMINDVILCNYFWNGRPQWFLEPELSGGGPMMNYGCHMFDRVQFLSSEQVKRVFAHIDWEMDGIKVDSSYQIQADLSNGVSASITCTGYSGPFVNYTDMIFKNGILRIILRSTGTGEEGVWFGSTGHDFIKLPVEDENCYTLELRDFLRYLESGCESPISGVYGEQIVKLIEASFLSNKTKKAVDLD